MALTRRKQKKIGHRVHKRPSPREMENTVGKLERMTKQLELVTKIV